MVNFRALEGLMLKSNGNFQYNFNIIAIIISQAELVLSVIVLRRTWATIVTTFKIVVTKWNIDRAYTPVILTAATVQKI
jgi:hypothetical protein